MKNFSTIASFGYLGLETRAATLNEEIMIAGHPGGRQKELSVVSDRDGGGRCRVNSASTSGNGSNTDIGYYCDTEGGSSGSPVIARSSRLCRSSSKGVSVQSARAQSVRLVSEVASAPEAARASTI